MGGVVVEDCAARLQCQDTSYGEKEGKKNGKMWEEILGVWLDRSVG